MEKNDTIPVYLTKFFHCRDELGSVGVSVDEEVQVKKVGIRAKNLYKLEVDGMSTELPIVGKCEKAMQLKLERELDLHVEEELMVPKDESQYV